ncbi:hypothetical protein ONZ51_g5564 [Trametes cubensis]|uniref:DUF6593 domain-containing protein n=1 Tax=Trametes cubensis TaxID=1111947 RepID=A0AAD7XC03_9APHY|nr:hypothetical protein ONZ51_g5564 [Trametes cubensis]
MRLYLVPNDPERTTLVSANGVAHYQVSTAKAHRLSAPVLSIRRSAESEGDSLVAQVEWRRFGKHPVVKSHIFDGTMQEMEVRDFLYKLGHHFTPTRYFLGDDNQEYRWKPYKDIGHVVTPPLLLAKLTRLDTGDEVARFSQELVTEGFFRGERKWCLQIQPTTLDIDMIVLTFIIMEKRRRDRVAVETMKSGDHDEDLAEGGGCEAGGGGGAL